MADIKPLILIQFTKQTSMLGEQVTLSTNLPQEASLEEIQGMVAKFGRALDERMRVLNDEVLKRTGKNLADMGLDENALIEQYAKG